MSNPNIKNELPWVDEGRHYIGLTEIRGTRHNKTIQRWLSELNAWWRDDETPWCGVFTAHCLSASKRGIPKHWYRAKAYASYGTLLSQPAYGCLGVMSRKGGGHVCFIIGKTSGNRLVVLGGNQNNQVSIASYPRSRFDAFVWPPRGNGVPSLPYHYRYDLPNYQYGHYRQPTSEA
ncbi:NlpC/P60 family protein [Psychrobacter lutiphocae]|uniref:NlpC/P60 family protein n=1 Tax=Psychrobacter lutiphocae TaxID=540500 RepID=UPI0003752078|nr:TIGR02594 family protein [Psychrobacter lutiphocae]